MNSINELQTTWLTQRSKKGNSIVSDEQINSVMNQTQKVERKNKRLNRIKAIAVMLLLIPFGHNLLKTEANELGYIGYGIIIVSATLMVFLNFHLQFRVNQASLVDSQIGFLKKIKYDMSRFRINFRRLFAGFAVSMVIGINLVYLDMFSGYSLNIRIAIHVGFTAFICLVSWIGLKVRLKRTEKEFAPIHETIDETIKFFQTPK